MHFLNSLFYLLMDSEEEDFYRRDCSQVKFRDCQSSCLVLTIWYNKMKSGGGCCTHLRSLGGGLQLASRA